MEQCFRAEAIKRRLLAVQLFHDCSMQLERGGVGLLTAEDAGGAEPRFTENFVA